MAEKTVNEMNIYYTAKDIEELVAKGVHQLELGPNTSLTDFARETAEQLDLALIDKTKETGPVKPPISSKNKGVLVNQSYNKPRGCQPGKQPVTVSFTESNSSSGSLNQENSTPVNRLVDMMGKIIKRGE
ncbi:MAG: hypothetical protein V3R33_00255 [Anaerolineales bacterium]